MKRMSGLLWVAPFALLLTACAGMPEQETSLDQARAQYSQLADNPDVRSAAPTILHEAENALERAAAADTDAERQHQIYLARQHMATARAVTERSRIEQQMQALAKERDRLRITAREQELERARSELAALEARRTERGLLVTLDDVFFGTDQTQLKPGAQSTIDKLADFLRRNPEQRVIVEGHTDSRGPADYNQRLSEQRAQAVENALVNRGIDQERIATRGYGESRPIASNENPGGRQLNRRVEVVFPEMGGA